MKSGLYECRVNHHRSSPKSHSFDYGVFFFYLDLDELDNLSDYSVLVKRNAPALYSFYDKDFIDDSALSCKDKVLNYVDAIEPELKKRICRITLLTSLRICGYIFNPVSIYYCEDADGQLICAVAEVTNTFRESKLYLVESSNTGNSDAKTLTATLPKLFYVSPFSDLDTFFDFKITTPDQSVKFNINTLQDSKVMLASSISGKWHPLCTKQILRLTLFYPLMTWRTITLIHWHALKLFLKGVPFISKEANPQLQTNVLRPHKSLRNPMPKGDVIFAAIANTPDTDRPTS